MKSKIFLLLMLLQTTCNLPASDCKQPHHRGAGILPYKVTATGEIYLLLGFEKGRGWSSFGGAPQQVESLNSPHIRCESRVETAIRETVEESRHLLTKTYLSPRIEKSKAFPLTPKNDDFVTYVIKINHLDLNHYYSATVLSHSGFTETSDIAWFSLKDIRKHKRLTSTPNGKPLWEIFWDALEPQLKEPYINTLFATDK